jgi:hypothetical protein
MIVEKMFPVRFAMLDAYRLTEIMTSIVTFFKNLSKTGLISNN